MLFKQTSSLLVQWVTLSTLIVIAIGQEPLSGPIEFMRNLKEPQTVGVDSDKSISNKIGFEQQQQGQQGQHQQSQIQARNQQQQQGQTREQPKEIQRRQQIYQPTGSFVNRYQQTNVNHGLQYSPIRLAGQFPYQTQAVFTRPIQPIYGITKPNFYQQYQHLPYGPLCYGCSLRFVPTKDILNEILLRTSISGILSNDDSETHLTKGLKDQDHKGSKDSEDSEKLNDNSDGHPKDNEVSSSGGFAGHKLKSKKSEKPSNNPSTLDNEDDADADADSQAIDESESRNSLPSSKSSDKNKDDSSSEQLTFNGTEGGNGKASKIDSTDRTPIAKSTQTPKDSKINVHNEVTTNSGKKIRASVKIHSDSIERKPEISKDEDTKMIEPKESEAKTQSTIDPKLSVANNTEIVEATKNKDVKPTMKTENVNKEPKFMNSNSNNNYDSNNNNIIGSSSSNNNNNNNKNFNHLVEREVESEFNDESKKERKTNLDSSPHNQYDSEEDNNYYDSNYDTSYQGDDGDYQYSGGKHHYSDGGYQYSDGEYIDYKSSDEKGI